MIVDCYLVNQTPTQSHNSPNNPSKTAVNFELEKLQPSEVTSSTDPVLDNTKDGLTIKVPLCETHVELAAKPAVTSENPLVLDDAFETLDPLSVPLERVSWWVSAGIVGGILLTGWLLTCLFFLGFFGWLQWIALASVLVLITAMISGARYFPQRNYETTSWQSKQHGLEIRRGIWWRHRIFIPGNRVQHTDVRQGPLERRFGLATLVVNTGGTHEPSISLSGLNLARAEELRDQLACKKIKLVSNDSILVESHP